MASLRIAIPLPSDLIAQEESRLAKERERLLQAVQKTEMQLSNADFTSRAPAELIMKIRSQLDKQRQELAAIENKLQ